VSPIWKIKCLRLEDNHMDLGFVDKDVKCISMAKSYIKWLGSIEIFMNLFMFLTLLHYITLGPLPELAAIANIRWCRIKHCTTKT